MAKKGDSYGEDKCAYEVGYGRPPKQTQFKKGQSGNPKGRPKKQRDIASTLQRTLAEQITYREGEVTHEMSAREAILYTQILKAMQGDQTAFHAVMRQAQRHRLLEKVRVTDDAVSGKLVIGERMSIKEWEEAARKQQAASKIASEKLYKEWFDE